MLERQGKDFDPAFGKRAVEVEIGQIRRFGTAVVAVEGNRVVGYARYGHTRAKIPALKQVARENRGRKQTGVYRGEMRGHKRHGYVFTVLTAPEARGKGIGKALVRASVRRIKGMRYRNGRSVRSVLMTRHEGNEATRKIAEGVGFSEFGRIATTGRKKHRQTVIHGKVFRRRK